MLTDLIILCISRFPIFSGSCVSHCGRYLIVTPQKEVKDNLLYFSDLNIVNYQITGKLGLVPVVTELEAD